MAIDNHSKPMPTINEIACKSIISRSRIPGLDYTINPYLGCSHGCVYCYARFMARYTNHQGEWGSFVDVKLNGPEICKKQIIKMQPGLVSLSTVTDPYQAAEKKYELTRQILMTLAEHHFPVSILTKSDLVFRDIDILKKFARAECEVGFSIATLNETVQKYFEPRAPSVSSRLKAVKELHKQNIKTWVFIAPVLPVLTRQTLLDLLNEINGFVDYVLVDQLNIKCGNWAGISATLRTRFPDLFGKWKGILFDREEKMLHCESIYQEILNHCQKHGMEVRFC